jgi:uncharacterized membrane protein
MPFSTRKKLNTRDNVTAVTSMEHEALASRSTGEKLGDAIARHAGKFWFLNLHVVWFGVWLGLNTERFFGIHPFDPYPYPFLTFVVSLESIFLSLFILMSQNRATRQADERAHLDLQINLLAEQESTKTLQMVQKLCEFHGIKLGNDADLEHLTTPTSPQDLLKELKNNLPEA